MYLILDVETNGLPIDLKSSIKKKKQWPNIIQISWQLHNKLGFLISKYNYIIYPNFIINKNSYNIHNINNNLAKNKGYNIKYVLNILKKQILKTTYIIGHNIFFDCKILLVEFYRNNLNYLIFKNKILIDTQNINIKNFNINKLISLKVLYKKLFNKKIKYLHNSEFDVLNTSKIFFYLLKNKLINYKKLKINRKDIINFSGTTYIKNKKFIYLHNYTYYSIFTSNININNLLEKIYKNKMSYFGIIDKNLMGLYHIHNYVKLFNKNNKSNLIYIIGLEIYVYKNNKKKSYLHPFIVKNKIGYNNLLKICYYGIFKNNKIYIKKKYIKKYNKGLIALSGHLKSKFYYLLINNQYKKLIKEMIWWKNIFKNDFYIEIFDHNLLVEIYVNKKLLEISKKMKIKYIFQKINYYLNKKEKYIYEILHCFKNNISFKDNEKKKKKIYNILKNIYKKKKSIYNKYYNNINYINNFKFNIYNKIYKKKNLYFFNTKKIYKLYYNKYKKGFLNLNNLLKKIKYYDIICDNKLPNYKLPIKYLKKNVKKKNIQYSYLKYLVYKGLKKKIKNINVKIVNRIKYELKIINKINFSNYFLIVKRIINKAKKMNILVGPGRGSVGGSLVAYCLGITNINPLKYNLLFERFLNKDRKILPDIDIDFDNVDRKKIIKWIFKQYKYNRVSNVITYNHLGIKSSIKDIAKIYDYPNNKINKFNKLLNNKLLFNNLYNILCNNFIDYNVKKIIHFKVFKRLCFKKKINLILKKSFLIKGIIKNIGIHPCGIIITKKPIYNYIPVYNINKKLLTQYDTKIIQDMNLLKMDFLCLNTLSIIKHTLKDINKKNNYLDNISLKDKKIFNLFKKGKTKGIFQFESNGISNCLKKIKPTNLNDLIALNALYRPGPIKFIKDYIKRKNNIKNIKYDLPIMKKYLKETYGIIIYQEQVMLLSRKISSFTKSDSDILRQAMGKKNKILLDSLKFKFINQGYKNGYKKKKLNKIWNNWENFSSYAFNKSHSTSYTYLSYQTAYLKVYYNKLYIKNVLNYNFNKLNFVNEIFKEYKYYYKIFQYPCINKSKYKFYILNKKIKFGLGIIKGIGKCFIDQIINIRNKKGKFINFWDFLKKINNNLINKRNIKILFYSSIINKLFIKNINKYYLFKKQNINNIIILLKQYNKLINNKKIYFFDEKFIIKKKINNICFNKKYLIYNKGFSFIKEKKNNNISLINNIKIIYKYEIKYFKLLDLLSITNIKNKIFRTYGVIVKINNIYNNLSIYLEDNFIKKKFYINKYIKNKKYLKKYLIVYIEYKFINGYFLIKYINLLKNLFNNFFIICKPKINKKIYIPHFKNFFLKKKKNIKSRYLYIKKNIFYKVFFKKNKIFKLKKYIKYFLIKK
ncbi:MAG: DNA polymerase III subunit alpha [Candidatus Shikimatogenerans sp. AspAUS03]|uniref:DNA polymerase III subunit alpha n=1 Tax=Candidatus Shikimatogenerans sp. AspAUS03 TaxID=3158563 RepID=A0AAU7QST3_9FLAO